MNIEIANRLVNLRKEKGLSQEQLAEKIGVSRQAVSKWERSEASPDTDNIILLARLYNISLDELLRTEDEIPKAEETEEEEITEQHEEALETVGQDASAEQSGEAESTPPESSELPPPKEAAKTAGRSFMKAWREIKLHVGIDGIYIEDDELDGEEYRRRNWESSLFSVIILWIVTLICAFRFIANPTRALDVLPLYLAVPLFCSLRTAIRDCNPSRFAYPVLTLFLFIFAWAAGEWQYSWLFWLTVPIYYWICRIIRKKPLGESFFPLLIGVIVCALGILFGWTYHLLVFFVFIPVYYWAKKHIKKG